MGNMSLLFLNMLQGSHCFQSPYAPKLVRRDHAQCSFELLDMFCDLSLFNRCNPVPMDLGFQGAVLEGLHHSVDLHLLIISWFKQDMEKVKIDRMVQALKD